MFYVIVYLLDIVIQNISEVLPATLRDQDAVAIVSLHLGDGHVATLLVLLDVEVEVLVLNAKMFVLRTIDRVIRVSVVILVNQFSNVLLKLAHSFSRDEDLEPVVATSECL